MAFLAVKPLIELTTHLTGNLADSLMGGKSCNVGGGDQRFVDDNT
jgi:hypothetical protein